MPNRIKADSASGLQLISDSSDEIQIQSGTDTVATVNSSGITMGSGKNVVTDAPAFSAGQTASALQSIANATNTKVLFATEDFDTTNDYSSSTFTPSVAGYYLFTASLWMDGANSQNQMQCRLHKNGSNYRILGIIPDAVNQNVTVGGSIIAYANGTTDYFEIYAYQNSGSAMNVVAGNNGDLTYFSGVLVRAV